MASLFRSLYDIPWLAPRMNLLFWGWRDFQISISTGIRQGTLEIIIEEVLWSIRGSYQTIWSSPLTNVKWHYVTWPYTMATSYWSDFVPNSTFYRIWQVSIDYLLRVWHAYSGRLLLRIPGPVPLGLAYVLLVEKKEEIWLSPMTKAHTPTEMSKGQSDNINNATKKFDYTAVADRLRTVSWSNYSHPTGVVNRFTGPPSH